MPGSMATRAQRRPSDRRMKVFVLGKLGSVTQWTEGSIAGFRAAGHEVALGVTRNPRMHRVIDRMLPRSARIGRAIAAFSPDLIVAVAAYLVPLPILRRVAALPNRPPLLGWVGDLFSAADRETAELFDAVAYTDSGLLALHDQLGFASRAVFLPHAVGVEQDRGVAGGPRQRSMVFVANPTPHRLALVSQVHLPLHLYGPGWQRLQPTEHRIDARRVGPDELAGVYRSHLAVLNIRNERNVVDGLNQRHFAPYLAATPVVADDQADLERCFEPGREILVYRDAGELNDIYQGLQREPDRAAAIGEAGKRRVLAEHTYARRLAALAALA
jgi:spore maturation protein CgeB